MKKTHLVVAGVLVLAVGATALVFATMRESPAARAAGHDAAPSTPLTVAVVRATEQQLAESFEVGGDVRAKNTATLVSRIVAPVTRVLVNAGDRVHAGQTVVLLDSRDLAAARRRAEAGAAAARETANAAAAERQAADAALVLAKATHTRMADLRAKGSATPNELDEAVAGLHAAEARVRQADAQIAASSAAIAQADAGAQSAAVSESYATIAAPFDGVVTQKLIDPGNMASPGVPLVTIEDTRSFRLEVRVDQSRGALVRQGQLVYVSLDGADRPSQERGLVSEVARVIDATSHAFVVKIDLPGGATVGSGMFGRARFPGISRRALAVPASTVVRHGQLTSLFVVDGAGIARMRVVSLGEADGDAVEVRAGLEPGDVVVVAPPGGLTDGARVSTRTAAAAAAPEGR